MFATGDACNESLSCTAIFTGLSPNTTYTCVAAAINAIGVSAESAQTAFFTTMSVPDAPSDVAAIPSATSNSTATVTWTAPTYNGGSTITYYDVTCTAVSSTVVGPQMFATGDACNGSLSCIGIFTGLSPNTAYTCVVTAINGIGESAESTQSAFFTTKSVPDAPSDVAAIPSATSNSTATVSWTEAYIGGSIITNYDVTCTTTDQSAVVGPQMFAADSACSGSLSCTGLFTGLSPNTTYTCVVTAINVIGESAASTDSAFCTTKSVPDAPSDVAAIPSATTNSTATVSWTAPYDGGSTITNYNVTCTTDFSTVVGPQMFATGDACNESVSCTAIFTGLSHKTTYTCVVTAINIFGESAESTQSGSFTSKSLPDAPSDVAAIPSATSNSTATVSWTAPYDGGSTITNYNVTCTTIDSSTVVGPQIFATGDACNGSVSCTAIFTGLSPKTTYTCVATAINGIGESPDSTEGGSFITQSVPDAPSKVAAIPSATSNSTVTVTWIAPYEVVPTITNYNVTCTTDPSTVVGPQTFTAGEACSGSLSCTAVFTGLSPNTTCTCVVTAINVIGESAESTESGSFTTTFAPWLTVGTAGFSARWATYTSLALDSSGTPFVAYFDYSNYKVTVMKYTASGASGWETVGRAGFSAGGAQYISLALDSSGTPFVAYTDWGNSDKATVMKYTGSGTSGWETVGSAGFSAGQAASTSLALDSFGTPFIAYKDYGNNRKATVMQYTGSGTSGWETVGSAGFSAGEADYTSLALDSSGTPFVAYLDDGNNYKATVMKCTGIGTSGWKTVGSAGFSAGVAYHTSLALDSFGTPFVAYQDGGNSGYSTVMKYTGIGPSGWETVGSAGFSVGVAEAPSLALDSSGIPFVAYRIIYGSTYVDHSKDREATVMKYTGSGTSGWETVGSAGFSAGRAYYPSLALDSSGTPFVAYMDWGNDGKATVSTFA